MRPTTSYWLFVPLCLVSTVIWWRDLRATFGLAIRNDAYTHILLILPICAILIVLRFKDRAFRPTPGRLGGSLMMGMSILIGFAGLTWVRPIVFTDDVHLAIEMSAIVLWWIGSFVFCFGTRIFRDCAFPLLLLLWLVPIPEVALNRIVEGLQHGTASITRGMFTMVGVPVTQKATSVSIPGLTVEVSEECSSIRSSMMLVVIAMVMSYLLLRSAWGRAIVILAAVPLCIAKNGLRVFTLTALGAYVDPGVLNSPLHRQGGVLFLAVALAGLSAMIWIVRRLELRSARPSVA
jgi:exosortase